MAPILRTIVEGYFDAGARAATTAEQGRALEDAVCYVFSQIPGVTITRRNEMNAFNTEEIDVALWNEAQPDGLPFLSNIILVECKNWSRPVSSIEVNWFDTKLRNRGLDFGILVATNGVTGEPDELTAAHAIIAAALRDGRKLIVLNRDEILGLSDSISLIRFIKEKLCDLAVKGAIM